MIYHTARRQPRKAFTLIEMILAVTVISFLLGSVAVALHLMFQVDGRLRKDLSYAVLLPRLSVQFRQDAHESLSITITDNQDESQVLTLEHGEDQIVRYQSSADGIVRRAYRDDEKLHHEVYAIQADAVRWAFDEQTRILQLRIERNVGQIKGAQDALQVHLIEAVVGLNTLN